MSLNKLLYYVILGLLGFMFGFTMGELAKAETLKPLYKIAIIDSGFTPLPFSTAGLKLCNKGHFDYNMNTPTIGPDTIGHGAYVTDLVNKYAATENVCFIIYKVFGRNVDSGHGAIDNALIRAYKSGARAINMSLYMTEYSKRTHRILNNLTKRKIKIYVASGNSGDNLNDKCYIYPMCYKGINANMVIIGALDTYGRVARYSNYGVRLSIYEYGDLGRARGTSFAAPRALGKYIRTLGLDND